MATPSPKSVVPASVQERVVVPEPVRVHATVIMSPEDAYIAERVASQPATLEEAKKVVVYTDSQRNRLSLPPYFEAFSHDCTVGQECGTHPWKETSPGRWSYGARGEFIFRWVKKVKRAIDHAMNVQGWLFVNRRYFPDAPGHLFSANGGVELGDVLLFFLPARQALALRAVPGQKSNDALKARLTKQSDGSVAMTGNTSDERFYVPEGGGEEDNASAGLQEGRDF